VSASQPAATAETKSRGWLKLSLFVLLLCGLFVAGRTLPVGAYVDDIRGWIDDLGAWGPVAFIAVYVVATLVAFPGSPLTIVAGALFGGLWGTVLVSVASTLGAAGAFLIARYVAHDFVQAKVAGNNTFRRLNDMVARRGAMVVALLRLVPLFPFNLLNYGLGLTRIPFGTYVFWSWLCMLPGTVLYVVGTDVIVRAVAEGEIPWVGIAAVAVFGVLVAFLGRFAKRRLGVDDGAEMAQTDVTSEYQRQSSKK